MTMSKPVTHPEVRRQTTVMSKCVKRGGRSCGFHSSLSNPEVTLLQPQQELLLFKLMLAAVRGSVGNLWVISFYKMIGFTG